MSDLIDTTEMYLKTVYELTEEGIPALRARIVERLGQSGPTVSETVARMERDGLVTVGTNREIEFTSEGLARAVSVMRRHRLAERLLLDVIKFDWPLVHNEACRWEHVISDDAAERIAELLGDPSEDPFGNPVPDRAHEFPLERSVPREGLVSLMDVEPSDAPRILARIAETLQVEQAGLEVLRDNELLPGATIVVEDQAPQGVTVGVMGERVFLPDMYARHIYVR